MHGPDGVPGVRSECIGRLGSTSVPHAKPAQDVRAYNLEAKTQMRCGMQPVSMGSDHALPLSRARVRRPQRDLASRRECSWRGAAGRNGSR